MPREANSFSKVLECIVSRARASFLPFSRTHVDFPASFGPVRVFIFRQLCCLDIPPANQPRTRTLPHSIGQCYADGIARWHAGSALLQGHIDKVTRHHQGWRALPCGCILVDLIVRASLRGFLLYPRRIFLLFFFFYIPCIYGYHARWGEKWEVMWFKYYKGYYDVRKLELELVSRRFPPGISIWSHGHPRVSRVSGGFPRLQRWPRAAEMSMASVVCRNAIEIPRGLSTPKRGRPITAFIEIVLSNSSRDSAPLPYSPVQRVSRFPPRSLARDNERAEDTRHGPSSTKTRTRLPPVRLPAERETNDRFCPCECALLSLSLSRKTRFFFLC